MQRRLLTYLVSKEAEEQQEIAEEKFKNLVFATSVGGHAPSLFYKMWPEDNDLGEDLEDVEWIVPETEDDLESLRQMILKDAQL